MSSKKDAKKDKKEKTKEKEKDKKSKTDKKKEKEKEKNVNINLKNEKKDESNATDCQVLAQLTETELKQFREAFQLFDKNNDGQITAAELLTVMRQLGLDPTDQEIKRMIAEVDKNFNDMVEFDEFVEMMQRHKYLADQELELRNAFKTFDQNGDGCISKDELRFVMTNLGENLTDAELDAMMREADVNGDGQVNYDEFVRMWMQQK